MTLRTRKPLTVAIAVLVLVCAVTAEATAQRRAKASKSSGSSASGGAGCPPRATCKDIATCEQAFDYLERCGMIKLDRDRNGLPCESGPC